MSDSKGFIDGVNAALDAVRLLRYKWVPAGSHGPTNEPLVDSYGKPAPDLYVVDVVNALCNLIEKKEKKALEIPHCPGAHWIAYEEPIGGTYYAQCSVCGAVPILGLVGAQHLMNEICALQMRIKEQEADSRPTIDDLQSEINASDKVLEEIMGPRIQSMQEQPLHKRLEQLRDLFSMIDKEAKKVGKILKQITDRH